ncbi:FKBP-type peptidyl-prolyl cis-trans isomerase [Aquimarina hainanensis]|uniref:peptidylprolyl isomerase n=1 Tax=Aquimarina hainanensis TaxID=1578017 RepID=A0ABW5N7E1_9FLAO|nr:hypothetical protein [Aquimarina sp. TRL1]QKX05685.1 hypothetical protein HN014_12460 [Aquimarina sp. TRL1]
MNLKKYVFVASLAMCGLYSCKKDDDGGVTIQPPRDRGEQQIEDDKLIQEYLKTHFLVNPIDENNKEVLFDTIQGVNSEKESLYASKNLIKKTIKRFDVEYTLYILSYNEGVGERGKATFADSTFIDYKGELFYKKDIAPDDPTGRIFDSTATPLWFDLPGVVEGFREAAVDFKGASGFVENQDGTVTYNNDFGHYTVFIPSGLAYFSESRTGIPVYSPIMFTVQLYDVNQADHDADGIPSFLEDLDKDRLLASDLDDNTDGDRAFDYLDNDDDNDGVLTKNEITVEDKNGDGKISEDEITYYDDDGDGVKNHLDFDDREEKNK